MQSELSKEAIISPQNKAQKLKELLKVRPQATGGAAEAIQEAAVAYYQSALELEESYKTRSYELLREENRKERADIVSAALCHYDEAIKLCPDYFEAYYGRGNFLFILNEQFAVAKQDFEKAGKSPNGKLAAKAHEQLKFLIDRVDRKWAEVKNNGSTTEFFSVCKEYLEVYPDSYEANYSMAKSLLDSYLEPHLGREHDDYYASEKESAKKDYLKIIKHFKKSIALDSENADSLYNFGKFYWYFMSEKSLELFITEEKGNFAWKTAIGYLSQALEKKPEKIIIDSIYAMLLNVQLKECDQKEIGHLSVLIEKFYNLFEFFDIAKKINFCFFLINFDNEINKRKPFEFHEIEKYEDALVSESYYNIYFEAYNSAREFCLVNNKDIDSSSGEVLRSIEENSQLLLGRYKENVKFQKDAAVSVLSFLWNVACFYSKKIKNSNSIVCLLEKMVEIYDVFPFKFENKNKQAILCSALYQMVDFYFNRGGDEKKVLALCERIFDLHKNGISSPMSSIIPGDNNVEKMNEAQVEVFEEEIIQENVSEENKEEDQPEDQPEDMVSRQDNVFEKEEKIEEATKVIEKNLTMEVDNGDEIRQKATCLCEEVVKIYGSTIDAGQAVESQEANKALSLLHKAKEGDASYGLVDYLFAKLYFYKSYIFDYEKRDAKSKKLEEKIRGYLLNAIKLSVAFSDKVDAYLLLVNLEVKADKREAANKVYSELKDISGEAQLSKSQRNIFDGFRDRFDAKPQGVVSEIQKEVYAREIAKKTNQVSGEKRTVTKNLKPMKISNHQMQNEKNGSGDISRRDALERLSGYDERFKDRSNKVKLDEFVEKIKKLIAAAPDLYEANLEIAESLMHYVSFIILSKIKNPSSITNSEKKSVISYHSEILVNLTSAQNIQGEKLDVHFNLWRFYWYYNLIEMIRSAVGADFSSKAWGEASKNCLAVLSSKHREYHVEEAVKFLYFYDNGFDRYHNRVLIIEKIKASEFFPNLSRDGQKIFESELKKIDCFRLNFYKSCYDIAVLNKKYISGNHVDKLRYFDLFVDKFHNSLSSPLDDRLYPNDSFFKNLSILIKEAFHILGEACLQDKRNKEALAFFEKIIEIQNFQSFPFYDQEEASHYIDALRLCIITKIFLRHEDGMAKNYAMRIIEIYNDKALFADGSISEENARDNNKIIYEVNMFLETGVWCEISNQVMGVIDSDDNQCDDIDQAIQDGLTARGSINNNSATVYCSGKSLQGSAQETSTSTNDEAFNALGSYTFSMGNKK